MPFSDFLPVKLLNVGQEAVSEGYKRIQVLAKTEKNVRVLVFATDKAIDIPTNYLVRVLVEDMPTIVEETVTTPYVSQEPVVNLSQEVVEEPMKKEAKLKKIKKRIEVVDNTKPEEIQEEEIVFLPPVEEKLDDSKTKEEVLEDTAQSTLEETETQHTEKATKGKKRTMRDGTAKKLVIEMLMKAPQTKADLAKAIIDHKLSKNGTRDIEKVINYVSVILSVLKNKDQMKVISEHGTYRIK